MDKDLFQGYKGAALAILKKYMVRVWGQATINTSRGTFVGTILPRSENDDDKHIVMKIPTGYNIGVDIDTITDMKETGYKKANYKIPEKEFPITKGLPNVKLFGTGGTIASRLDYRTGAVIPAFSPGELYGAVPELADICNLTTEKVFAVFSENMGPTQYKQLAIRIGQEIENGIDGIVIGHGTDTLHHTGAALTFMVQNSPIPIVLVGSQRSSDRPSSDAALNLMHAMKAFAGAIPTIHIILVLPADHLHFWEDLIAQHHFNIEHQRLEGGTERFFSVKNGLEIIPDDSLVAIHDGVRPFIRKSFILDAFQTAQKNGNAIPCTPLNESVRKIKGDTSKPFPRDLLRIVQTPQVFQSSLIKKAYQQPFQESFTDDATVLENFGYPVHLIKGDPFNIKITFPEDLIIAEALMRSRSNLPYDH